MNLFRRNLLALPALLLGRQAFAQAWPSRPIRVIVPYAASGGTDLLARALAEALRPHLPHPMVVENRAGGAGVVGSEAVAHAEPDGHTMLCVVSTHVANKYFLPSMPYDAIRDFSPVALLTRNTMMLATNIAAPYPNLRAMLDYARSNPGRVGTGSTESLSSFIGQELARRAQVEMPDVAYRSGGQLMNDIVAGRLPSGWTSTASVMPHMQTGRVRLLAASTASRSSFFPDVPTAAGQGIADFDLSGWVALLAPKGLPVAISERMYTLLQTAFTDPALLTRLTAMGIEPDLRPAPALLTAMQREDGIWAAAAAAGTIKQQ